MQGANDSPVRAAKAATRERIVECAMQSFVRCGYEASSIRSIARHAGLSDAAIHYHFRSKQELLAAVIDSQAARAGDCRRHAGPCTTRSCLVDCVVTYFFTYVALPELIRILLREQIVNEPTTMLTGSRLVARFADAFGPAFSGLYGEGGPLLLETVDMLLSGILWNEILDRPDDFPEATRLPAFRQRVRGLISLLLPPACAAPGVLQ